MKNNKRLAKKQSQRFKPRKIFGTQEKPRLCVFRSNKCFHIQIIRDDIGHTIAFFSTKKISSKINMEVLKLLVNDVYTKFQNLQKENNKMKICKFDCNYFFYSGKIKYFAELLREKNIIL